jgi:membrane fusion protein (multidrug efflux system)
MPQRDEERDRGREERASSEPHGVNSSSGKRNQGGQSREAPSKTRQFLRRPLVRVGIAVLILVLIVGGLLWWLNARKYETTDDAFIDAHIVQVSPQIAGQVIRIYVNDNQLVREGEPLIDIDLRDATARLNQVVAQLAQAQTQIAQARSTEAGAAAQAANAARDLARYNYLKRTTPAAVAQQQIDQAQANAKNAAAQRDAAQAQIKGAEAQIKVLKAQEAQARLNLGYTRIVAPVAGHIAQRSVALGNYVTPGQQLMAIVPLQVWVTANYKETQLARMRVGQPVTIDVDACPDAEVHGHIDSIQRGAGQAFGILPPENATGNFVKVVQRVPVKIVLDKLPRDCPLGPGMSVGPSVKVR